MEIILNNYKQLLLQGNEKDAEVVLNNYAEQLKQKGWMESLNDGCIYSPDHSTCFITNRIPYKGQLAQTSTTEQASEGFKQILELLKSDFIIDGIVPNTKNNTISNINDVVEKEEKKKASFKLTEEFNRFDTDVEGYRLQLDQRIKMFVEENKNNPILKQYMEMQAEYDKTVKEFEKIKDLYMDMETQGVDLLEGVNITLSLTHTYMKKEIDKKVLEAKYPEIYNEVLVEKPVKGHVTVKRIVE